MSNLVDIHSHILWGVDDGSQSQEMSLQLLRLAVEKGTEAIFATPHVIDKYSSAEWQQALEKLEQLRQLAASAGLPLRLYSGAEVLMNWDLLPLLGEGGICCLADSNYMLVELPMHEIPVYAEEFWFALELKGITPVLAHPERYLRLIDNWKKLLDWRERGVLLQINSGSLTGMFGKHACANAQKLLTNGLVDFIGSDAHRPQGRNTDLTGAAAAIKKLVGEEYWQRIAVTNPQKIIANEAIIVESTPRVVPKRSLWQKIFGSNKGGRE